VRFSRVVMLTITLASLLQLRCNAWNPPFTYPEHLDLPRESMAVLTMSWRCEWCISEIVDEKSGKTVFIGSQFVEGTADTRYLWKIHLGPSVSEFILAPGPYSIEYLYHYTEGVIPVQGKDSVVLLAGHSYRIFGGLEQAEETVWIEDTGTGEVIAGVKYVDEPLAVVPEGSSLGDEMVELSSAASCFHCLVSITDAETGELLFDRRMLHVYPGRWLLRPGRYTIRHGIRERGKNLAPLYREPTTDRHETIELEAGHEYKIKMRDRSWTYLEDLG